MPDDQLFAVSVKHTAYIAATSVEEAIAKAKKYYDDIRSDMMPEHMYYSARQVESSKEIPSWWIETEPYGSSNIIEDYLKDLYHPPVLVDPNQLEFSTN